MKKIWIKPQPVVLASDSFQSRLGLSPIVAAILARQGLRTTKQVMDFLRPSLLNLHSPWAFREMAQAIDRLALAQNRHERILIYGDYDVDGVTSTAMLYKVLTDLQFRAVTYIPNREEGYGLNKEAVQKAAQADVKLIITVDCGITAVEEVDYARELGMDVILTDHHEPPVLLPKALAILNPKVPEAGYPFRELAGVGVAFKLAQALLERLGHEEARSSEILAETEILDLVALGTIADLVPLTDENRIIVAAGLKQMEQTVHRGLQALLEECGLGNRPVTAGQIAFLVAPRINAAGRMESAKAGLELLLTGQPARAQELARHLSRENTQRQETEKEILAQALTQLEGQPLPRVLVLSAPNWHPGVIGIVASRLVERFYRPVYLLTEEGEEAKGSARGIYGYHVYNALCGQADLLDRFGGHSQAAGFSLKTANIAALRERLNQAAAGYPEDLFCERVKVDQIIPLPAIDGHLLAQLEQMAPFGWGNPNPVLAGIQYPLYAVKAVGKDKDHLKCLFGPAGEWEGIAFRQGTAAGNLQETKHVDVTFGLDWNTYQGADQVQLILKDIETAAVWEEETADAEPLEDMSEVVLARAESATASAEETTVPPAYDWRTYGREQWLKALREEAGITSEAEDDVLVWDGLQADPQWSDLGQFLARHSHPASLNQAMDLCCPGSRLPESDKLWSMIIICGIPTDWEEWDQLRLYIAQQEHMSWALAETTVSEAVLRRQIGCHTRDELIRVYRVLAQRAHQALPSHVFSWRPQAQDGEDPWEALRIFEELGLIRVLGGTKRIRLEWIPAQKKLDLESSLRYHSGKQTWEQQQCFAEEFQKAPWAKLITGCSHKF